MAMAEKQDSITTKDEVKIPQSLIDQAGENKKTFEEINEQKAKLDLLVPQEVQEEIAKTFEKLVAGGIAATSIFNVAAYLVACKSIPSVEIKQEAASPTIETTPSIKVVETTSPTTEKADANEIKGKTFDFSFNQEDKTYRDKETGEIVGILVEKAYKQGDEWQSSIGFSPEALRKILNENKEKGIFKPPWPFDFEKNKGIEVVELVSSKGGYKYIGLKYTEPISLYAASDCVFGYKFKYIPQKNDSFSSQDFGGSYFSTGFEVKDEEGKTVSTDYEVEVVDWNPSLTLKEPWLSGRWEIQEFQEEIKIGQFMGQLLPSNPNYSFLDFRNRQDWYENPDRCQASLWINIFGDNLNVKSDLDKILRVNGTTVFVWPNNEKMS